MASTFKSTQATAKQAAVDVSQAGIVAAPRYEYNLAAALIINDIIVMGDLPAGHVPVDCIVDSDDLDTNGTPLIVLQAGILNAGQTDIDTTASGGASWIGSSTVAQAGGIARASDKAITRAPVSAVKQTYGIKVSAAPATGTTTGKVGMTLSYRPVVHGA